MEAVGLILSFLTGLFITQHNFNELENKGPSEVRFIPLPHVVVMVVVMP
jgi:hypothetical protein